jgi:CRISPR-associated protein Cmr5
VSDERIHYVGRAQEQARFAWNCVTTVKGLGLNVRERYATLARKLPGYLQVSGLGQTMAFLYARSNEDGAERTLRDQLHDYLHKRLRRPEQDVMEMIVNLGPSDYRRATQELMQMADWLKRFAEGI